MSFGEEYEQMIYLVKSLVYMKRPASKPSNTSIPRRQIRYTDSQHATISATTSLAHTDDELSFIALRLGLHIDRNGGMGRSPE